MSSTTVTTPISSASTFNMSGFHSPNEDGDDFTLIEAPVELPMRLRSANTVDQVTAEIHPLHNGETFIVSIQPPKVPARGLKRATCDIVLVIDVSGSMSAAAPLPDGENEDEREAAGLSVLDLTKHAARTIMETLGSADRLGIVTFSDDAKIVQELIYMTPSEKKATLSRIEKLRDEACTNLWAGIRTGLDLFAKSPLVNNVQGLFVLTDGMPNHMCPKQGYVAKLGPMLEAASRERSIVPAIHTFGFGYQIRSELMQSIAEVGKGSYAFIPDAGMIGTAFVHAVANIYTTLGTSTTLELTLSNDGPLYANGGLALGKKERAVCLSLGNIQYGQSRDLVFYAPRITPDTIITAKLNYKLPTGASEDFQTNTTFSNKTRMPPWMSSYHVFRSLVCDFLARLFPLKENGEHTTKMDEEGLVQALAQLDTLAASIRTCQQADTVEIKSLLADLVGDEPTGQISKALLWTKDKKYWGKWGRHYLPSLLHAHQRQTCNTFKDPGPLLYGRDSPLFVQCRTELDAAFDSLPAPKPSRPPKQVFMYDARGRVSGSTFRPHKTVSMNSYNNSSAPCFEGNCKIKTGAGTAMPIKMLKPGMSVWTPMGARRVVAVLKTRLHTGTQQLCRVGNLLVTPWHPIKYEGRWIFPNQVAQSTLPFHGSVYSVLLAPFRHPDGHAIQIDGHVCVTLGHGLVKRHEDDVRGHAFFGNYRRVLAGISRLPLDANGHSRCGGLARSMRTGLASGFIRSSTGKPAASRSSSAKALRMKGRV